MVLVPAAGASPDASAVVRDSDWGVGGAAFAEALPSTFQPQVVASRTRTGPARDSGDDEVPVNTAPVDGHELAPEVADAMNDASAADIHCVAGEAERRTEVIYAYPADRDDNAAAKLPLIRQTVYMGSAYVDVRSRAIDPTAGRRMPYLCSGGEVHVSVVQLDALGTSPGLDLEGVVSQLVARGYPASTQDAPDSKRRFLVFYDGPAWDADSGTDAFAGMADYSYDDQPGVANKNNTGDRYVAVFKGYTHWALVLHEQLHAQGAVQGSAPGGDGAHCLDGVDTMCTSGGVAQNQAVCDISTIDCAHDSYFNPTPAPGSYLATHWNLASTSNRWLVPRTVTWSDGDGPDVEAPSEPTALVASEVLQTGVHVRWAASSDTRSGVHYDVRVDRSDGGGGWVPQTQRLGLDVTRTTIGGLPSATAVRVRVSARDESGNHSDEAVVLATTLAASAPQPPSRVTLAPVGAPSWAYQNVQARWTQASVSALASYEVEIDRGSGWQPLPGTPFRTTSTWTYGPAGSRAVVRVRTHAADGSVSEWRESEPFVAPETGGGGAGGSGGGGAGVGGGSATGGGGGSGSTDRGPYEGFSLTVTKRTMGAITLAWTGIAGRKLDVVELLPGGTGKLVDAVRGTLATSHTFQHLTPGEPMVFAVRDPSNVGVEIARVTAAPLADKVKPGAVKLKGRPKVRGAVATIAWLPARDNHEIRSYELERKVGRRWVPYKDVLAPSVKVVVGGLKPGKLVQLRVRAVDVAGNAGTWTFVDLRR